MHRKTWLWIELFLLYGGVPLVLTGLQLRGGLPFFPVLFGFLGLTLILGGLDPAVRFRVPDASAPGKRWGLRIVGAVIGLTVFTALFFPDLLFRLPRKHPLLWTRILLLYPLLSVAPQEFLYRTFFMQRYRPLFRHGRSMLWANALFFGWGHVFFLNGVAPALSVIAGFWLAKTWQRTRSFRWVCVEHALYGQMVFTTGVGWWFYTGSAQSLQHVTGP